MTPKLPCNYYVRLILINVAFKDVLKQICLEFKFHIGKKSIKAVLHVNTKQNRRLLITSELR